MSAPTAPTVPQVPGPEANSGHDVQSPWVLCGLSASGSPPLVGLANVFVSHAWSKNFTRLVETVDATLSAEAADAGKELDPDGVFLWVDIFTVLQNRLPSQKLPDSVWWAKTFREAVASFGTTLVVMDPWFSPVCVTRAWCLWEIFSTVSGKCKLLVGYHPDDAELLGAAASSTVAMLGVFSAIDVRQAQAAQASDLEMIKNNVMGEGVSLEALNTAVCAALRERAVAQKEFRQNQEQNKRQLAAVRV